jgi:carboxypeptidase family protein
MRKGIFFKQKFVPFVLSLITIISLLHSGAGPALAQRATASVAGSVTDASQAAVPAAAVVVRNLDTGVERTVESNELGYYVVPALPAGTYSVTVSKTGFQTNTVPQLVLGVDQNATINIVVKVGAVAETVEVSANA